MVKELREQLAAERELRDSHQKRAESLQEDLFETRTARESLLSQLSETATAAETLQGVVDEQKRQLSELQEAAAADRQHQAAAERSRQELQQLTREAEARIAQVRVEVDDRLAAARRDAEQEWSARLEQRLAEAGREADDRVAAARAESEEQWQERVAEAERERGEEGDVEARLAAAREEVAEEWRGKMEARVAELTNEMEKRAAKIKEEVSDDWKSKLDAEIQRMRDEANSRVAEAKKSVEEEWQKKLDASVAEAQAGQEEKLAALRADLQNESSLRTDTQLAELRAAEEAKLASVKAELTTEWEQRAEARVADALAEAEAKFAAERKELESEWQQNTERQLAEARAESETSTNALKQQIDELQHCTVNESSDFDARISALQEEVESQYRQGWEGRLLEAEEKVKRMQEELEGERQNGTQRLELDLERRVTETRNEMQVEYEKKLEVQSSEAEERIKALQDEIERLQRKHECKESDTQTDASHSPSRDEFAAEIRAELESSVRAAVTAELESSHQRELTELRSSAEAERAALRSNLEREHQQRTEARIAEVRSEVDAKISATLQRAEGTLARLKDNLEAEYARKAADDAARLGAEADVRVAAEAARLEEELAGRMREERERWEEETRQAQEARARAESEIRRETAARLAEAERAAEQRIAQLQNQLDAAEKERRDPTQSKLTPSETAISRPTTPRVVASELDIQMQEELARITSDYEHQVSEIRADLLKVKAVFEEEKRASDDEKRRQVDRSEAALSAERLRSEHQQQQLAALSAELAAAGAARTAAESQLAELRAQLAQRAADRHSQPRDTPPAIGCERCREADVHHHCQSAYHGDLSRLRPSAHAEVYAADARRADRSCLACSLTQPPSGVPHQSFGPPRREDRAVDTATGSHGQSLTSVGIQVEEKPLSSSKKSRDSHRGPEEPRRPSGRRRWDDGGASDPTESDTPAQRRARWEVDRHRSPDGRRGRRWAARLDRDSSEDRSPSSRVEDAEREERSRELTQLRSELGESRAHVAELQSSLSETARQAAERQDQMEARVARLTRQLAKLQLSRQLTALGAADGGGGRSRRASALGAALDHLAATEEEELDQGGMVTFTPRRVQSEARLTRHQAVSGGRQPDTPAPAPRRCQSEEVKVHRVSAGRRRGGGGPRRAHCSRRVFPEAAESGVFPDWRLGETSDVEPPPTDRSEPTSCSEPPPRAEPPRAQTLRLQALELAHAEATLRLTQEQERSARLEQQTQELRARCREARRPPPTPRSPGLESALLSQLRRLQETVGQEQERRGLLELELERLSAGSDAASARVSRQLERLLSELRHRPPAAPPASQTELRRLIETEFEGEARRREHLAEDLSDTRRLLTEQMVRLGAAVSARDKREETFVQQCEQIQLLSAPSTRRSIESPINERPVGPGGHRSTVRAADLSAETQRIVPLLPELREPAPLPDFKALASSVVAVRPAPCTTSAAGEPVRQPSAELSRRIRHELDQSIRRHLTDDQEWHRGGSRGGSVSSVTPRSSSTVHANDEDAVNRSRKDYLTTVVNLYSL